MLLQKSFKVFKKWKGAAAVTAVFLILFCVVGFDLTGFETRVPDAGNVASVEVSGLSGVSSLGDSGDRSGKVFTDPERIKDIIILHRAAVDQRDGDMLHGSGSTWLTITYHLKGGGTMSRSYYFRFNPGLVDREGSAAWALQRIFDDRELFWQLYGFDELEDYLAHGGRLTSVQHDFYNSEIGGRNVAYYYGSDAETLFAAVKEDFFAGRIGARQVAQYAQGNNAPDEYLYFNSYKQEGKGSYICIAISGTASRTWAVLEKLAPAVVEPDRPGTAEAIGW